MQASFVDEFKLPTIRLPFSQDEPEYELRFYILMRCNSEQIMCDQSESDDTILIYIGENTYKYPYSTLEDNIWLEKSIRVRSSNISSKLNVISLSLIQLFYILFH